MYDVMTPIKLENDKVIWHKVGVAFEGDETKKYKLTLSLISIPINIKNELKLYIFKKQDERQPKQPTWTDGVEDDNIPF